MNLEAIRRSQIALSQKDKNDMIPLIGGIQRSQIQRKYLKCSCQRLKGTSVKWLKRFTVKMEKF